jgi:WD40 repeat protein
MITNEELNSILDRISKSQQTNADIEALHQLLSAGNREVILQLGKYNINIGEGNKIYIGDQVYPQWDDRAIQALIAAIQKVKWQCVASLTENDYTQGQLQSTGIDFFDKLAKQLTDFSQEFVMHYGLKVAFSPNCDRPYFISGGHQIIKHWQIQTRQPLQEIPVPGAIDLWITSVAISPNGQLIAACKAYEVKIWQVGTTNAIHTFSKTPFSNFLDASGFDSVVFSPDGKLLAANDNQDIKIWDVESGREVTKLSGHTDKVTYVAFNPNDQRILASCSYDKNIKVWNIENRQCMGTLSGHRDAVYSLAFSPNGEILASGSNDNTIQLWDLRTAQLPQALRQHSDAITCLAFSPDGTTLVSGSNDGRIIEWDITTNESHTILSEQHKRGVTSIALSPDGKTLISGGRDQTIKIWSRGD